MALKATILLIASGLTGSGIVAFTRSADEPETAAFAPQQAAVDSSSEAFQQRQTQARVAAQRPFASLCPVLR